MEAATDSEEYKLLTARLRADPLPFGGASGERPQD
jgi:hypothetical protein